MGRLAEAYIALGSNLGNPRAIVRSTLLQLQELSDNPVISSSLWETTPVDCPPGSPRFVNAAARLIPRPEETPESLLLKLQAMETEAGRQPKQVTNEPRLLDLDLIAFGEEVRNSTLLILPHPRALVRRFVLVPLCELAPGLVLPGQLRSVSECLATFPEDFEMVRVPNG